MPQYDLFGEPTPLPGEKAYMKQIIPVIDLGDVENSDRLDKWIQRPDGPNFGQIKTVQKILSTIQRSGDKGLLQTIDSSKQGHIDSIEDLKISKYLMQEMHEKAEKNFLAAIRTAIQQISMFHIKQHVDSWFIEDEETQVRLEQRITPIRNVAILLPENARPTVLIMTAIPAKLAGVERIIVAVPPENGQLNPCIGAVIHELGLEEVILIDGAQAVGAFAFGTESIEPVDKIVGPSNQLGQIAKRQVLDQVGIDFIDSRRDLVVLADEEANPEFIGADFLAQCEYPSLSKVLLFTTNEGFVETVTDHIDAQLKKLENKAGFFDRLQNRAAIFLVHELGQAVPWINEIAPQYVHIVSRDKAELAQKIKNAGTILLGEYSPEAVSSVLAGPNLIVPSMGMARFISPLGVDDFVCRTNIVHYTARKLKELNEAAITLLEKENLAAHIQSIQLRLKSLNEIGSESENND